MILTWMVWSTMIAALLGVSAHLAEVALRERGWPTRSSWVAAMAGSVGFQAWAVLRPPTPLDGPDPVAGSGWALIDPAWLAQIGSTAVVGVPTPIQRLDDALLVAWVVSATLATTALLGGLAMLRARASRWHRADVQGESVLLSGDFGPALVGVVAPEIVLPRWALRLSAEDLRLACLHEAEHRAAHDTWLLFAAALAVTLMPWNLALWWQTRRLRAAVEVDCDARVLRRGVPRRAYGALLLELGSARARTPLPVLGLAKPRSLLERRLTMIVRNVRERRPLRSLAAVCVGSALVVVACETPAPTTVDAERSDVSEDLDASSIERIEIRKSPDGEPQSVQVFLTKRAEGEPLVYLDGIQLEGELSSLAPDDIERIEVLKGDAATAAHGPDAAAGVILITMKEEAAGRVTPR